jgi:hypothetical protein
MNVESKLGVNIHIQKQNRTVNKIRVIRKKSSNMKTQLEIWLDTQCENQKLAYPRFTA